MHFLLTLLLLYASVSRALYVQLLPHLLPGRNLQRDNSTYRIAHVEDINDNDETFASNARPGERCGPGFCGITAAHCNSPDCQLGYGTCDADKTPQGPPTKHIIRPRLGSVPYGEAIMSCKASLTFAMTFDDGPNEYTSDLLDILDKFQAKATFFITGVNSGKGQIDDFSRPWGSLIQRMHRDGHQLASHTWSHQDLNKITHRQRRDQLLKNEAALRNIMGGIPTYMRPPYSNCNKSCMKDMAKLGYHVVYFDLDTADYLNDSPEKIQVSKAIVNDALSNTQKSNNKPFLAIGHDTHAQTVYNLTAHILQRVNETGYRAVTVGECLNDPRDNWYRWDYRNST
ncbi:hypothetical protein UA08_07213 [Talaromyces atroroseus]|uniref:NodB homology domain-containing protein n=1 Tax=Talaromyces atroroseus TaxID=1441469 RepID=A0A225AVY7_TALAT|nr:hypothetical protein UA08_07213 [Talaromyces atroroseus]OKL57657.1 hypothetical protein UA08_07213 [Talaromyces atroroseus]